MTVRGKSLFTVFLASILGTAFLWCFNIFYVLKDWSRFWEGFLIFFMVVTILVTAACAVLFFLLKPIQRAEKRMKKGEDIGAELNEKIGKAWQKMPLTVSLINIIGFIIGPMSKIVISSLRAGRNPFDFGLLTAVVYSLGIGFYVAFIEIRLIENHFRPLQKARNRTAIDQTKPRSWAKRQYLQGVTILILASSLFFAAGVGFVKNEITLPARVDGVTGATMATDSSVVLWQRALAGEEIHLDWNSPEIIQRLQEFGLKMGLLFLIIVGMVGLALLSETKPTEHRLRELIQRLKGLSNLEDRRASKLVILRGDELGEMVHWINCYTDTQSELTQTIASSIEDLGRISQELTGINSVASSLGKGVNDGISLVQNSLESHNNAMGEVEEDVVQFSRNVEKIYHNLAEQNQAMETSSTAVEEMVASISSVSQNAQAAFQGTHDLVDHAKESSTEMSLLLEGIRDISSAAEEVNQTLSQIAKLAAQTNMLAMNAAIEAAHAGTAGAGFAVVAAEVRSLAENSSRSTKRIGEMIHQMNQLTSTGLDKAGQAQISFLDIETKVKSNGDRIAQISQSMKEQEAGSKDVQTSMSCFKDLTTQVSKITESQSSQGAHLRRSMEELRTAAGNIEKQMEQNASSVKDIESFMQSLGDIITRNSKVVEGLNTILERS